MSDSAPKRRKILRGGPIEPFHSKNPGRPFVYHDRSDCFASRMVPAHNRVPGTGDHRRCQHCADVEAFKQVVR